MKILFSALHCGYFRNFESTIVDLVRRGHQVHIVADEPDAFGGETLVERLAGQYPAVTFGYAPSLDDEAWFRVARKLRIGFDYVRFHDGAYAHFRKTRAHLADRIPRGLLRLLAMPVFGGPVGRYVLKAVLWASEQLMPVSEASRAFIERHDPDVVLLASVTAWRSPQIDHLRAARALGRRVGICVFSWDHLSSKALLRVVPDRVFVWNETQKKEAVEWHGMPADRVVVTGAQCYDQWFDRGPSRDRASFCRDIGLSPDHPILLYVCSVMTPDPCESRFVLRWIEEIRRSPDPRLREAGILVRPHPERVEEWEGVSLERFGNAVLYGRNPLNPDSKAEYFDSLYHSHVVVGLVTSAFLEAAIVGRPVHTLLPPEFAMYQEGVQHFRYLMEVEGGILQVTRSFPEHLAQLASAVAQPVRRDEQNSRFVRAFVRPQGLDVPATPALVAAIENMAAGSSLPAIGSPLWHRAAQPLVRRLVQSADEGWLRGAMRDTREMDRDVAEAAKEAAKAEYKEAAAKRKAERFAEKTLELETRRRERRREQRTGARRKQIARLKGALKALVGLS